MNQDQSFRSDRMILRSAGVGLLLLASPAAFSYIGTVGSADGYDVNHPNTQGGAGPANWTDVSYFNAGQYGANAGGGGGPTPIAPNSGLWKITGQVGGFYPTSATRNAALSGSPPPYPASAPGAVAAYMVGHHFPGRGGDNANLAFRNDTPTGTGPAIYDYYMDTFDFGGPVPASVTSGNVQVEFYFCPNPADPPSVGGHPLDKFTMSFKDSVGNTGLQWGYARDNEVSWRTTISGSWNYTGIYADAANWDGVQVDIDLTNDTFELEYYDISTTTWLTLAPAGTALGTALSNLSVLGWQLEDGVISGTGGKNYFDDFDFTATTGVVPEGSTMMIGSLSTGLVIWLARRRRGAAREA